MSLNLIGTYEGLPFYADVEITDEEVQASWLDSIRDAIRYGELQGFVPVKVVMRGGAILAFPEDPADMPEIWRGAWQP